MAAKCYFSRIENTNNYKTRRIKLAENQNDLHG